MTDEIMKPEAQCEESKKQYLSFEEMAVMLDMCPSCFSDMMERSGIPYFVIDGKMYFYRDAIEEWFRQVGAKADNPNDLQ